MYSQGLGISSHCISHKGGSAQALKTCVFCNFHLLFTVVIFECVFNSALHFTTAKDTSRLKRVQHRGQTLFKPGSKINDKLQMIANHNYLWLNKWIVVFWAISDRGRIPRPWYNKLKLTTMERNYNLCKLGHQ